jgi:hypothetical protein
MTKRALNISEKLKLPLDTVTATLIVLGGKGMGKTNLGGVLVEELTAHELKWAVLDPMGVWWGIRHSADGKGKGIPCLILGGAHGDIPIEPTGGAVVADLVADERANVVIDVSRKSNGEMWTIGERIRFVNDYGKQLFKRQGSLIGGKRREPIMQVVDESARFIPQMIRAGQPELAMCASTWSTIVEEGRNVGLGVTLLTQRSARLNKDVAELADVMFAFRTIGPNSLDAVTDWLSGQVSREELKAMGQRVRTLPVGSALVVSPGWLHVEEIVPMRKRWTFDSSATPKAGQQTASVRGEGAKPDLAKYAERMHETIERAKDESVPELKKRIRELESKLAKPVTSSKLTVAVDTSAVKAEIATMQQKVNDQKRKTDDVQRKVAKLVGSLERSVLPVMTTIQTLIEDFRSEAPPAADQHPVKFHLAAKSVDVVRRSDDPTKNDQVKLRGKSVDMLIACARMYPKGLTEAQVASQAGIKRTGGTFSDYKSLLRTSGCVRFDGGLWTATEEGMRRAGADIPAAPSSTAEVLAMWLPKLRGKSKDMLRVLVDRNGETMTREQLGAAVGVQTTGGTFSDYLSLLRTADLIVTDASGVRANAETLLL